MVLLKPGSTCWAAGEIADRAGLNHRHAGLFRRRAGGDAEGAPLDPPAELGLRPGDLVPAGRQGPRAAVRHLRSVPARSRLRQPWPRHPHPLLASRPCRWRRRRTSSPTRAKACFKNTPVKFRLDGSLPLGRPATIRRCWWWTTSWRSAAAATSRPDRWDTVRPPGRRPQPAEDRGQALRIPPRDHERGRRRGGAGAGDPVPHALGTLGRRRPARAAAPARRDGPLARGPAGAGPRRPRRPLAHRAELARVSGSARGGGPASGRHLFSQTLHLYGEPVFRLADHGRGAGGAAQGRGRAGDRAGLHPAFALLVRSDDHGTAPASFS